ncbi:MAG: peptidyl-prolyl cis-trans isomerase [Candidatus Omnitrophica bacterium]|nr:peptidyl-prolyl cis-trans isomerase [Candidatus Omnitrophota bacterium]
MLKKRHALLLFLALTVAQPVHAAIEDTIVAVVNDEVITLNDLRDYIDARTAQMRLEGTKPGDVQKFMMDMAKNGLDRLIEDKILLNAANKNELALGQDDPKGEENRKEAIEAQVDSRLNDIRGQYRSDEEFLKALIDQGVSVTDVRNRIRNQIKTKRLVDQQIRAKIYVNPQEITAYYKNHFEEFQKPDRVNLDSIFIAKGNTPGLAREKTQEVLAKLKEGKDFGEIMKEYSQAPSIGIIKKGQALPEIENVVFSLATGQTSEICEVANGFYIFRLTGRVKAELAPLEEVREEVNNRVFQQKFQERFEQWLGKLKKDAFVDIKKNL